MSDIDLESLYGAEVVTHCPYETAWLDSNSVILKMECDQYVRCLHERFAKRAGQYNPDNKEIFELKLKGGQSVFVSFFDGRMAIALGMWPQNQSSEKRIRRGPFEEKK